MIRKLLRILGAVKTSLMITAVSILSSALLYIIISIFLARITVTGVLMSIILPAIVAPFVSYFFVRLLLQLDLAERAMARINDELELRVKKRTAELVKANEALQAEIAERKRAEEALKESEAGYRELAESITDVFFAFDKDLRYTYWNRASEKLTGTPAKDAIGKSLYEIFPDTPETRRAERVYLDVLRTQQPQGFVNPYQLGGKDFFFEISAYPSKGGLSVFVKDITERKRAEEALRESEERLCLLVQNMPAMIDAIDAEGNLVLWNRECERVTGYSADEIIGNPKAMELLYPNLERLERVMAKVAKHVSDFRDFERDIKCRDGSFKTVSWANISNQVPIPGWHQWAVGVDITERKRAEEQIKASLQEKEVLLKEIHHRVKNNLQVISSLLYLQSKNIQDRKTLGMFQDSQYRVRSMALVHERLYQSQDLARVDFAEYVRSLAKYLFRSYGVNTNIIRLKINSDDVSLGVDTAIPCGLIINELVSNSLKHAFPEGRTGEIHIELRDGEGQFRLVASDDGVGFPKDLDFRNTKTLGLQLVNTLVEQLKGTIELDRSGGTAFKITCASLEQVGNRSPMASEASEQEGPCRTQNEI